MKKIRGRKKLMILTAAVLAAGLRVGYDGYYKNLHTQKFTQTKVEYVLDGDTIVVSGGQHVRYLGIDAPEVKHKDQRAECFGAEASYKNKVLAYGKSVILEKDISDKDKYGRLLRYVWLAEKSGATTSGKLINDILLRQGFARALILPPNVKYSRRLLESQSAAKKSKEGLWTKCHK